MLDALGKEQHNKTDKDATVMSKPAHNLMAYNSQIAVDDTYKFIVATDIICYVRNNSFIYVYTI